MLDPTEVVAEVRALSDENRALRPVEGYLVGVQGTRLTVRTGATLCPLPFGTLVEVNTDQRLYLGEVKYFKDGLLFIEFDHELEKAALETIRRAWTQGTTSDLSYEKQP